MNIGCSVIKDLLPLYADDVCSTDSKKLIEDHICSCDECRNTLFFLKEEEIDNTVKTEINGIIEKREKKQRKKAFIVGSVFSAIYMIPVIVCLIVNLCVGNALNWFFIVLSSLFLAFSLTALPLLVQRNKFLLSLLSSVFSLIILLLSCAVYTRGKWFFVSVFSSLFGLSVVLLPIVLNTKPLKEVLNGYKSIIALSLDTVLYTAMMISIERFTDFENFRVFAFAFSLLPIAAVWIIILSIRYLPITLFSKFGVILAVLGLFTYFYEYSVLSILGSSYGTPIFSFGVSFVVLSVALILSLIFFITGMVSKRRKNK